MGSSARGRQNRAKGVRYQNRVANRLEGLLDRPFARNLDEYRLANDGDVAERLDVQDGALERRPVPLWIECKRHSRSQNWTSWKSTLIQAIDGVHENDADAIPVGWARLERFLYPHSADVVLLRRLDLNVLINALVRKGVWDVPVPIRTREIGGKRPRWREPLQDYLRKSFPGRHRAFLVHVSGDRPLDAAFLPEADFLEILGLVDKFDAWDYLPEGEVLNPIPVAEEEATDAT